MIDQTYGGARSHRGLLHTQRITARGIAIMAGAIALATVLGRVDTARGSDGIYAGTVELPSLAATTPDAGELALALDSARGQLEAAREELHRARQLIDYSARYNIAADLAASVYDEARRQGLDPELGFRLVRVESNFDPHARSRADALGLTQVQLATARFYDPDISEEDLFDRSRNLEIGFRFLSELLEQFDGDLRLALIAYNRGPGRLRRLLAGGVTPWNGYASSVLNGYAPAGPDPDQGPSGGATRSR